VSSHRVRPLAAVNEHRGTDTSGNLVVLEIVSVGCERARAVSIARKGARVQTTTGTGMRGAVEARLQDSESVLREIGW
jgi:hypothetical protein